MKKIIQNHAGCIGCGACAAVCPDFWEMGEDGKSQIRGGILDEGKNVCTLELEEDKLACNKEAVEVCPVRVISIEE